MFRVNSRVFTSYGDVFTPSGGVPMPIGCFVTTNSGVLTTNSSVPRTNDKRSLSQIRDGLLHCTRPQGHTLIVPSPPVNNGVI